MALGALLALERSGVRVPADMSVTGFDDTPESAFYHPPLTTVEADFDRTGRAAFRRLLGLIEGGAAIARTDAPVRLIVRESTGPAPS
jgi:LacI family transcriptional regulator